GRGATKHDGQRCRGEGKGRGAHGAVDLTQNAPSVQRSFVGGGAGATADRMDSAAWAGWWRGRQGALGEAVRDLVEVNSFTENRPGGLEVGRRLARWMAVPGIEAATVPSERFADHRVFRTVGNPRLAPVALLGHLDTVFPPGVFEGYRVDGALRRGPGVRGKRGGVGGVGFALRGQAAGVPGGGGAPGPLRLVWAS